MSVTIEQSYQPASEADVKEFFKEATAVKKGYVAIRAQLDKLQAQFDEYSRDAMRYRFIREHISTYKPAERLDAAIDDAMGI